METKLILTLNTLEKVKNFSEKVILFDSDIDVLRGRYVIDAKSTLGIFTIDLTLPVEVEIHSSDENEIRRFNKEMEEFIKWI